MPYFPRSLAHIYLALYLRLVSSLTRGNRHAIVFIVGRTFTAWRCEQVQSAALSADIDFPSEAALLLPHRIFHRWQLAVAASSALHYLHTLYSKNSTHPSFNN